jgi:hypothetical protein
LFSARGLALALAALTALAARAGGADQTPEAPAASAAAPWPLLQLVAIDTPVRTYLDVVPATGGGAWSPASGGWPLLAQWENATASFSAVRAISPFVPGDTLSPAQLVALLPRAAPATRSLSIADAPCSALPAPADATAAIQCALNAAGQIALGGPAGPVDVVVPPGSWSYAAVITVPRGVRLRGAGAGISTLEAADPAQSAVNLAGNGSGALFLTVSSPRAAARLSTPQACGVWVGPATAAGAPVSDTLALGVEVVGVAAAHFFAIAEHGGVWLGNFAHDGFADAFHHTGGSSFAQVVANRASGPGAVGDDLFAFVGYAGDGDPVHHCSVIGNFGRLGAARGVSAVGAGFIAIALNDINATRWAGIYLAQEDGYRTFGSFDLDVRDNVIDFANLAGSHAGLLAYSDSPAGNDTSRTFGAVPHRVERVAVANNSIADTARGIGGGSGIEVRSSVDSGDVACNVLERNVEPQLVCDGTRFARCTPSCGGAA